MYLIAYSNLSSLLVVVALGIMITALMMRSQRRFTRRRDDGSPVVRTPRPGPTDRAPSAPLPAQGALWEVYMHDVARELSGQLDSKMGALEQLIREADRASARLEAALAGAADESGADGQAEKLKSAGSAAPVDRAQVQALAAEGSDPQRRYEEIHTLADYGFAAAAIAQRDRQSGV